MQGAILTSDMGSFEQMCRCTRDQLGAGLRVHVGPGASRALTGAQSSSGLTTDSARYSGRMGPPAAAAGMVVMFRRVVALGRRCLSRGVTGTPAALSELPQRRNGER